MQDEGIPSQGEPPPASIESGTAEPPPGGSAGALGSGTADRGAGPPVLPSLAMASLGVAAAQLLPAIVIGSVLRARMPAYYRGVHGQVWLKEQLSRPGSVLAMFALMGLAHVALVWLAVLREPRLARSRLGLGPANLDARSLAVCALQVFAIFFASAGLGVALTLAHVLPEPGPSAFEHALRESLNASGPAIAVALVIARGLFPGVGEELLFRGFVQRGLLKRWRPVAAVVVTSALFAAWHGLPIPILYAFAGGCWLGWLAWRLDSIVPGMVLHGLLNSAVAAASWLRDHGRDVPVEAGGWTPETIQFLVLAAVSVPVAVVAQRWLARTLPAAPGRRAAPLAAPAGPR